MITSSTSSFDTSKLDSFFTLTLPKGFYFSQPPAAGVVVATDVTLFWAAGPTATDISGPCCPEQLRFLSDALVGLAIINLFWITNATSVASSQH
jgi:hypothetical protein